jgi:hypothetical protein
LAHPIKLRTGGYTWLRAFHLVALKEIVIGHHVDPDFGALELTETHTEAAVNGGPRTPLVFRPWTGKQGELDIVLSISGSEDPPIVADEVRADFRSVMSNVDNFKQRIARSELERAKDWVAAAGKNLPLDESRFASLLKIEGFTIGPDRLTVWIEETANIFGGHSLEARIEMGEIIEICMAG